MFISPAFAQTAGEGGGLFQFLPFILIFVVFYFLLIRPQQKRARDHREMVAALKRGDKIVTSGGLIGTISKAVEGEETIEVEIAKDVKVTIMRAMIADRRDKSPAQKGKTAANSNKGTPPPERPSLLARLFALPPKK